MSDTDHSFAEAAGRFERLVRKIKAEQYARTGLKTPPPPPEPAAGHPLQAWETNYAVHSVRPGRPLTPPKPLWGLPSPAGPAETDEPRQPLPAAPAGPIGLAIGKPVRKRGWMGRLFRG